MQGRIGEFVVEQPMVIGHESAGYGTADSAPCSVGQKPDGDPTYLHLLLEMHSIHTHLLRMKTHVACQIFYPLLCPFRILMWGT